MKTFVKLSVLTAALTVTACHVRSIQTRARI